MPVVVRQRDACILYATLLLLNFTSQTWQDEEFQNSDLIVLRGNRTSPDRIQLCPTKPGGQSNSRHIESDSIKCSQAKDEICGENGYTCACSRSRPTYIVSKRQCVNNLWLRGGDVYYN